jgi:uncharacterized protein
MTGRDSRTSSPAILTAYDCWGLLETEEVARVAWAAPGGVAVVPVNYTVADGALWFRTQPYTALGRQCGGGRVAVEVDHIDRAERSGWSVVVAGTAHLVPAEQVPDQVMEMRVWAPGVRSLFVRVEPVDVSGRRL